MNDHKRKVIKKYYEFITTRIKLVFLQKKYQAEGTRLKYIFKKSKSSNDLIVVFSSCTRPGLKARYNYMRTLSGVKANQLFILDDFAADKRGSYYLGKDFSFNEERATLSLIKHFIDSVNAEKTICVGSSKGGYAALNFGLQIDNSFIIAGAPQYYLSTYLHDSSNMDCYYHIVGEDTPEKGKMLDEYLQKRIHEAGKKRSQKIYLHYSDKEHVYFEHIQFMLKELETNGFIPECDVASYTNHSDVSYYFPDFLVKTANSILI